MTPKFNRVVIAGAGAGLWAAIAACRILPRDIQIEVYDPDNFKGGTGHLRLPKPIYPSQPKVVVLRGLIEVMMGDRPPKIHAELLAPESFEEGDWTRTIVLDATDMHWQAREEWWDALRKSGAKGIRMSYDGTGVITISPGPPMIAGDPDEAQSGYALIPHLGQAMMAAGFGACALYHAIFTGEILELNYFMKNPAVRDNIVDEQTEEAIDQLRDVFQELREGETADEQEEEEAHVTGAI